MTEILPLMMALPTAMVYMKSAEARAGVISRYSNNVLIYLLSKV